MISHGLGVPSEMQGRLRETESNANFLCFLAGFSARTCTIRLANRLHAMGNTARTLDQPGRVPFPTSDCRTDPSSGSCAYLLLRRTRRFINPNAPIAANARAVGSGIGSDWSVPPDKIMPSVIPGIGFHPLKVSG